MLIGVNPTVNILGVYFPGWLVSSAIALVFSYALVRGLGRNDKTRAIGQSGLFFCSLTVASALALWWMLFSRF
jgi:hypothetical protein